MAVNCTLQTVLEQLGSPVIVFRNDAVDAQQDIVTIQDREMRIVRGNKVAHDLCGDKPGELKGKKCHEVFLGKTESRAGCPVKETGQDCCPHMGTIYINGLPTWSAHKNICKIEYLRR